MTQPCLRPLPSVNVSKNLEKGICRASEQRRRQFSLVNLTGNNGITLLSIVHGVETISKVQRYSRTKKSIFCSDILTLFPKTTISWAVLTK